MKTCPNCNSDNSDANSFCGQCGRLFDQDPQPVFTSVRPKENSPNVTILILGILTIVGSIFTIWRGLYYEIFADEGYWRGWVYAISSLGTLGGAILMIQRNYTGLIVYTAFQSIYILTVLIAILSYAGDWTGPLALAIGMLFLIPSTIFLVLYWALVAKHLQR